MPVPFLLEIGAEEIPDWMIPGALVSLQELAKHLLPETTTDATPRRLVLRASAVPERQPDTEELVLGPAKSAPAQAVAGFARKQGVPVEALTVQKTPRGEYYGFVKKTPGRAMCDVLAEALPGIIANVSFPKTMYWTGKNGVHFIRPIRWIVALLGGEVIPFEVAGVQSGDVTSGHRRLGAARVQVSVVNHEEQLRANGVILSAKEREDKIRAELGGTTPDEGLLQTLVYVTEFPTVIEGAFDPEFLTLPEEVLITVMKHHQKYFSVSEGGRLAPQFKAVMNIDGDPEGLVRRGHERVLRARFNDARFFWDADQKKKLADRVSDLAAVTFQARLGSYLDKTNRMTALARELGGDDTAVRAALLAKADLTTELVKEFTELQGVVGGLYARAQGEPRELTDAIYDHYKPVSMEDSIPRTRAGQIVSIADKLDTLRGCFGIDLVPSGSRDPFALRRAAQGIVKIIVEAGLKLPLPKLLQGDSRLEEFLLDRVRYYFREIRGFAYDEINAVLASGWDDLVDAAERLAAIQSVRPTENFEPLAASFKRIRNILKQAQFSGNGAIDPQLIEPGPEAELHAEFVRVRDQASEQPYQAALETIASIRPKVDLFFDKVLVNAKDEKIRRNRLALLHTLLIEFSKIADFSEIVTNN